ncbi:MAG: BamA/TamA family outer membrane protein [Polyangiaceae bacterium]
MRNAGPERSRRRGRFLVLSLWAALACALSPIGARASDPLNSSDRPTQDAKAPVGSSTEFNVLPVAGGTTDIGFGGGFFIGLVRVRRGYDPYEWNIESDGLVTFKSREGGGVILPYQDISVTLTVPRFLDAPLHLEIRPSYSYESTLNYYGIGNASSAATPVGSPASYHEYTRIHPEVSFKLSGRIADHLAWRIGLRYVQTWVDVQDNSRLATDLRAASPEVKSLLGSTRPNAVVALQYGLQFDNRDNDVSTHSGSYESVDARLVPGGVGPLPYRYGRGMATTRVFIPIWKPRITLALRAVGDWLIGAPPFYELSTFDTTYAIGGQNGVRGVPAQRYYGKIKVFGNVELRTQVASFRALGKPFIFGMVAFLDGGRVWTDIKPHPELDGTGVGLKYGVGGGLRLQSGTAFVLRADVAWSPDATPVGGYFAAGEMF